MPTENRIVRVDVDWDEKACMLMLEFEGDGYVNWYTLDDPEQLYECVKAAIGPWLQERDEAFAEFKQATLPKSDPALVSYVDGSCGYDISDPKHPRFHSVHADVWDAREGK